MVRWFTNLLYGTTPAEFISSYGLDESVHRLSAATGRSVFSALFRQRAVGKVTSTRVSLQRAIPLVGNSFKPFFVGQFEETDVGVVLTGKFSMLRSVKVFNSVSLALALLWVLLAMVPVEFAKSFAWWFPLSGIGIICANILIVWVGKWFARNDVEWLSQVIQEALSDKPLPYRFGASYPQDTKRKTILTFFLPVAFVGGVLLLIFGIFKIIEVFNGHIYQNPAFRLAIEKLKTDPQMRSLLERHGILHFDVGPSANTSLDGLSGCYSFIASPKNLTTEEIIKNTNLDIFNSKSSKTEAETGPKFDVCWALGEGGTIIHIKSITLKGADIYKEALPNN